MPGSKTEIDVLIATLSKEKQLNNITLHKVCFLYQSPFLLASIFALKTELAATLTYGDQNDKDNNIYYRILKTTFYEGGPEEITGLHTEALGVLSPVDSMDSCEEMMIQDWPGALYKKDDTAFLCWTYSPEVTYVLEYTPSKIDDSEIIKMAESAEPVK